jgi:steroid delta-isomerase-like uncharacterized protein
MEKGGAMSAKDEAVVRRFYEEMNNDRNNAIAPELFTADHAFHDPQISAGDGPEGVVATVTTYQVGLDGHWRIDDIFSSGDKVVVRWTGEGTHVGDVNGMPATGKKVLDISAISIHRMDKGKIAETWEVWDTLGFLQQLGVVPAMG